MVDRFLSSRQGALDALQAHRQLWMRLAAVRRGDQWRATAGELTSGPAPSGWEERTWQYEDACFTARVVDGRVASRWFQEGEAFLGDGLSVQLPPMQESVQTERRASKQQHVYQSLDWPCTTYDLARWTEPGQHPPEPLISAAGAPSYQTYLKAASYFFNVEFGSSSMDRELQLRVQNLSARITSVVVTATELTVSVDGDSPGGAIVELASDVPGPTHVLASETVEGIVFPLAEQPANAWVLLKRDAEWLDRKYLRSIHTLNVDPDVEYVAEPETEVRSIIAQGETSMVEFKSRLPDSAGRDRKYRDEIAGTVAAFANERGGWLLLGIANNGTIEGLELSGTLDEAQVSVANMIKDRVTPLPSFEAETLDIDGQLILVVTVDQGSRPPYGVDHRNPRYYVRRGGTTFPASAEVVRQLARSRPALPELSPFQHLR